MKNAAFYLMLTGLLILLCVSCIGDKDDISPWPEITKEAKPWTRWWWMGNAVDKENITRRMEEFAQSGIGGVEITPIYGVKGFEEHFISHLSPEWMEMLVHTLDEAKRLDMGVDIFVGDLHLATVNAVSGVPEHRAVFMNGSRIFKPLLMVIAHRVGGGSDHITCAGTRRGFVRVARGGMGGVLATPPVFPTIRAPPSLWAEWPPGVLGPASPAVHCGRPGANTRGPAADPRPGTGTVAEGCRESKEAQTNERSPNEYQKIIYMDSGLFSRPSIDIKGIPQNTR